MKFQCNTKPLNDALALGVVNGNISKYYAKSVIAQLTASRDELRINLEASYVLSEIIIKGIGDDDKEAVALVDNLLFKNLISTLDDDIVTIEFKEGGIVVYSGKSNFTIPNIVDNSDIFLERPKAFDDVNSNIVSINKSDWKFVEDSQMYSIAMSFEKPVYTKVWVGEDGEVLVGDMSKSMFTYSEKSNLDKTCLLSDTIVNLLSSLPEETKMRSFEDSYILNTSTDGYTFTSQFTPQYEDEDTIGDYNSDIILNKMTTPDDYNVYGTFDISPVSKLLSQSDIILSNSQSTMMINVHSNMMNMTNDAVEGDIVLKGNCPDFSLLFNVNDLKDAINHYSSDSVCIYPVMNSDSDVVGIVLWNDDMTTLLPGAEE